MEGMLEILSADAGGYLEHVKGVVKRSMTVHSPHHLRSVRSDHTESDAVRSRARWYSRTWHDV